MVIKVIVLDFDGVIVESVGIKTEAFRELFRDSPQVEEIYQYHLANNALSRFEKFPYICENILGRKYTEEIGMELSRRYSELVFQKVVDCPMVNGAAEFLQTLSVTHPLYLVSTTPQDDIVRLVKARGLHGYFKEVWGIPPGDKVGYIRRALEIEKAKPIECVYVGDMLEDFRIAQRAGVTFVGRENTESFAGLDAPVFPDMTGIMEWIKNQ